MLFSDVVLPKMSYLDLNDLYLKLYLKCFHIPLGTWAQTHCHHCYPQANKQNTNKQNEKMLTAHGTLIGLLATDFVAQQIRHSSEYDWG